MAIKYSQHIEVARAMAAATKTANVPTPPPSLIGEVVRHPAFLAPLAMMGVGAAVGGAQSLVTKLMEAKKKNQTFRGMLELNPTLQNQDQTTIKRVFNSLHNANPHFMNDPMVAGALVHNTIEAQSAYGADQPMVALAKQVSELSQGRASIMAALEKEKKMRSSWSAAAERAVEGGFGAVKEIQAAQAADPLRQIRLEKEKFEDMKNRFDRERAKEQFEELHAGMRRKTEDLEARAQRAFNALHNPPPPPSSPAPAPGPGPSPSLLGRIRSIIRGAP